MFINLLINKKRSIGFNLSENINHNKIIDDFNIFLTITDGKNGL